MRVTVRLDEDLSSHVDAVRQDSDESNAEAVRTCIERSQQLEEIEAEHEAEIDDLEAELQEIRADLQEERRRADRAEAKLEVMEDRVDDKDSRIESLEQTVSDRDARIQELTNMVQATNNKLADTAELQAADRGSVLGGLRARIFGSDDGD